MRVLGGGISGVQLTGGATSGGVTLSNQDDVAFSDLSGLLLPCDATVHSLAPLVGISSPPVWLDAGTGKIVLPGLYAFYYGFAWATLPAGSAAGEYLRFDGVLGARFSVDLNSFGASGAAAQQTVFESGALGAGDVPSATDLSFDMPSDPTGVVNFWMVIYRQAYTP